MIPKVIHYCWLSNDVVPDDYLRCMETWKQRLTDWEFILWDTKRFDINKTTWTRQAFDVGMYACASDYIRFFAVYSYGGVYLDMDMEVIKPFNDLLNGDLMLAYENHVTENLEAGCFGAVQGHPYIKKCMEYYETNNFIDDNDMEKIVKMDASERHHYIMPIIAPELMKNALACFMDKRYEIRPREYFTAKNIITGVIEQTKNTYTVHHFATQYHSAAWRKIRKNEQNIRRYLGEKSIISFVIIKLYGMIRRIRGTGFISAMKYYCGKYITKAAKK
jgi:mannosyltransferase OCH1-like enzyme